MTGDIARQTMKVQIAGLMQATPVAPRVLPCIKHQNDMTTLFGDRESLTKPKHLPLAFWSIQQIGSMGKVYLPTLIPLKKKHSSM